MGEPVNSNSPVSNVARFLPEAAARLPDFPAVKLPQGVDKSRTGLIKGAGIAYNTLTFAQLETLACASAAIFSEKGIQRGTRVLLMVKPGRDLILSVFALFKLGAVPVVIDPGMGRKHFLSCVRRTRPTALVGIPLAQLLSRVFRKNFSDLEHRVTVGNKGFTRQLEARGQASIQPAATTADELAAILFTSGSTGPPKGVCYEHGMFEAQVRMIRAHYDIQPGEVDLPMLPIFALFNPALGMTTIVPEMNPSKPATVDPANIVQAIHQNEVTNSFGSPVLWNKIATFCEQRKLTLPSIHRVLMAGAAAPPALIERMKSLLPNGEIHTPYGATEVLPVASMPGSEILADTQLLTEQGRGVCVGRPLPEVKAHVIAICDEPIATMADAKTLSEGQIGEFVVTGPSVTKAYDGLAGATAKAKIADGPNHDAQASPSAKQHLALTWHRMGDLGYFDTRGRMWFCGRMAERVETAKGPMFTECVEAFFNQHPRVFRSALVGLGSRPNQKAAIVIEPKPGRFPAKQDVYEQFIDELQGIAEDNDLPFERWTIYFCAAFPVDVRHNAKIHRLELARMVAAGALDWKW